MSAYIDKEGKFIHFTVNASMERDDYDNNASEFIIGGSVREVAEMVGYAAELHPEIMPYMAAITIQLFYCFNLIGTTEREILITAAEEGSYSLIIDVLEEMSGDY